MKYLGFTLIFFMLTIRGYSQDSFKQEKFDTYQTLQSTLFQKLPNRLRLEMPLSTYSNTLHQNTLFIENIPKATFQTIPFRVNSLDIPNKFQLFGYQNNAGYFNETNLLGIGKNIEIASNFNVFVSGHIGSGFYGRHIPNRTNFGALNLNLRLNISEKVILITEGQISTRLSSMSMYMPHSGLGNTYYRGSIVIPISPKIGVECGIQRDYFRGKWITSYYVLPYFY